MGKVSRLIGMAERMGRRKGLLGRSSTWLGVWVAAAGYRKLRDFLSEEPEIIREEIGPGQQLVITHYVKGEEPPEPVKLSRRQRRKARRAQKKLE